MRKNHKLLNEHCVFSISVKYNSIACLHSTMVSIVLSLFACFNGYFYFEIFMFLLHFTLCHLHFSLRTCIHSERRLSNSGNKWKYVVFLSYNQFSMRFSMFSAHTSLIVYWVFFIALQKYILQQTELNVFAFEYSIATFAIFSLFVCPTEYFFSLIFRFSIERYCSKITNCKQDEQCASR